MSDRAAWNFDFRLQLPHSATQANATELTYEHAFTVLFFFVSYVYFLFLIETVLICLNRLILL